MMHVDEQGDKSLSIYIENPDVVNIPDVPMISLHASWFFHFICLFKVDKIEYLQNKYS